MADWGTGGGPKVETSPQVADQVKYTTCYMCACRCGIKVYLKDGTVRYIEGNRNHPVNRGVLCAKGSAGIMQHYSPARLRSPLLRVGPRGSGEFKEISWDEALETAARPRTRTPGHANGLGRLGRVRQWETAHTQANYVRREMGIQVARKHARKPRFHALLTGFLVPLALSLSVLALGGGLGSVLLAFLAALIAMLGMLIERWLFFAEAQHVVTLYYGAEAA